MGYVSIVYQVALVEGNNRTNDDDTINFVLLVSPFSKDRNCCTPTSHVQQSYVCGLNEDS